MQNNQNKELKRKSVQILLSCLLEWTPVYCAFHQIYDQSIQHYCKALTSARISSVPTPSFCLDFQNGREKLRAIKKRGGHYSGPKEVQFQITGNATKVNVKACHPLKIKRYLVEKNKVIFFYFVLSSAEVTVLRDVLLLLQEEEVETQKQKEEYINAADDIVDLAELFFFLNFPLNLFLLLLFSFPMTVIPSLF